MTTNPNTLVKKNNQPLNRKQWLITNLGSKLTANLKAKNQIVLNYESAVEQFESADPSKNHSGTQWLIETYLRAGFRWEDIVDGENSKAYQTLKWFSTYRKHLPPEQRSLYNYQTLADLYGSVEKWIQEEQEEKESLDQNVEKTVVGKPLKRQLKKQAYAESYSLYETDSFKIIIPLTRKASEWWGQGTQWCTASVRSDNYFDEYNKDAPLFILLFEQIINNNQNNDRSENKQQISTQSKKWRKLQFWTSDVEIQWMDERDSDVDPKLIDENWEHFEHFIGWMIKKHPDMLKYFPENKMTQSLCDQWFECFANKFNVRLYLNVIPEKFKSDDMYIYGLENYTLRLNDIPEHKRTYQICLYSVKRFTDSIKYVPKNLIDEQIIVYSIKNSPNSFREIDSSFITAKTCELAVQTSGYCLQHIPERFKTYDLCRTAVMNYGSALEYVPEYFKNSKMCWLAIKSLIEENSELELNLIPYNILDYNMCLEAIQLRSYLIEQIPSYFLDKRMCLISIKDDMSNMYNIPDNLFDQEISDFIVNRSYVYFQHIPYEYRTKDLCLKVIQNNPYLVKEFPKRLMNEKFALEIAQTNISSVYHIDRDFYSYELVKILIKENPYDWKSSKNALEIIPQKFLTKEILGMISTLDKQTLPTNIQKKSNETEKKWNLKDIMQDWINYHSTYNSLSTVITDQVDKNINI